MNQSEIKENTDTVDFGFISNWLSKLQESGTNPRSTVILLSTLNSKQLLISVAATEKKKTRTFVLSLFQATESFVDLLTVVGQINPVLSWESPFKCVCSYFKPNMSLLETRITARLVSLFWF